jgi:hypothetical protein
MSLLKLTGRLALLTSLVSLVILAPTAMAGTHRVSGTQIVVDEDAGLSKMKGGLVGRWKVTSFEPIETEPYFHARGTEEFTGCLDRRRDRSCKRDPSGTLSFTFEYWGLYGSADPASLVWGACWHPIVSGTGGFAGARGVIQMVDTPTPKGVKTAYIGNVTLGKKGARRSARRAGAARSACGPTR